MTLSLGFGLTEEFWSFMKGKMKGFQVRHLYFNGVALCFQKKWRK